jgi:hypothetical protein
LVKSQLQQKIAGDVNVKVVEKEKDQWGVSTEYKSIIL